VPDPVRPGETIYAEKLASRGEIVDIPFEDDIVRGERFGAFEDESEEEETVVEVGSIAEMSDDELMTWIKEDKPTVRQVVEAAEGDPELAQRLLDAEDAATGGDSRTGVIQGLTHIVANG
jgi:hypothetical protein